MTDESKVVEKIIDVNLESEMKKSYIDYAMSVIVARALPDARDGLKPVHRRILYSMNELNMDPDKPYRKSARLVGDVLGKYHPHGDAAVYDSMVRMAQDFSLRYMLVDGHGNFGSVDGDPPAAMRYTEARMSKITLEMLRDIEKDTVNFVPNFDDTLKEPDVLPSRFPNLLVNGSSGIAVGMATNVPPHNLGEIIDGIIKVIDEDNVTIADLMKVVKGPDFPTGGIIMGTEGIKNTYETGRGRIIVRAKAEIEENGSKQRIVVTELPYMVNKARLLENIANLVKDKRIDGISDLRDESDRDGMRMVIELKRDANANVVLNLLYKFTQMQDTFGAIVLALVDKQPQVLNLRQCIDCYLDHQKDVILRRTRYDLDKAEARLHILEGLKIALDYIDEVIKIIRAAYDDPKERLMERFGLTDIQAQAILDMRLKTLSGLQREKIEQEYNELVERVKYFKEILGSETLVYKIIKDELLILKEKFADERRTAILPSAEEIEVEDLIKEEDCVITLTHFGYIKRLPADTYRSQKRGGKGVIGLTTREEDFVENIFISSTHQYILFFTNKGKTYRLKAYEVPEGGRQAKGTAIVNLLQLDQDEKITAVIPIAEYAEGAYLLMATKLGVIKKTSLMEYINVRKGGLQGISLRENDELIDVRLTDGTNKVVIVTRKGLSITFDEKDVRPIGRVSQGVRGIDLSKEDYVIGMEPIVADSNLCLLAITENGFGKRTEVNEYRVQARGGKGVLTYKVTERTGSLISIKIVNDSDDIILISSDGTIIRLSVKDISILGRNTQGVTLMRMPSGVNIVSVAKVAEVEDEEEK